MSQPVVASYCTTFLKPEMLHVYRQVTNLRRWRTFILTLARVEEDRFPFPDVEVLRARPVGLLARGWRKYVRREPSLMYRGENDAICATLARHPTRLMHIYFGHTAVHLLPFIASTSLPVVVSFHGMDTGVFETDPRYRCKLDSVFTHARLVLARSRALLSRLEQLGCPVAKLRLNPTGIPMEAYPAITRQPPANGEWRIIQACRLIEKKGLPSTLEAFAIVSRQWPSAQLLIAGDGPMRTQLEQKAGELGIAGKVGFLGFLNQEALAAEYHRSHIFIHPSQTTADKDQEGIPNSMLEAMATGLPVVATRHSGIPEAVDDERSGFLVEERDHHALAASLMRFMHDPALWMRAGECATREVRTRFELHEQVRVLENCYCEAADEN